MKLQEATEILVHEIIPKLSPSLIGNFQVTVLGMHRNHAEIGISLVNKAGETLKYFGTRAIRIGDAISIDNYPSMISFVKNTPKIKCFFQAWLIGVDKNNTEAEISIRLVDENRKKINEIGIVKRKAGGRITVNNLDITLSITPKRFH